MHDAHNWVSFYYYLYPHFYMFLMGMNYFFFFFSAGVPCYGSRLLFSFSLCRRYGVVWCILWCVVFFSYISPFSSSSRSGSSSTENTILLLLCSIRDFFYIMLLTRLYGDLYYRGQGVIYVGGGGEEGRR